MARGTPRVAIIGAEGQLGTELVRVLSDRDVVPLAHPDLDVADGDGVRRVLSRLRPDVVVNTAAFNRVDECETEVERAFRVNGFGPLHVAAVCGDLGCAMVHFSTDYVFGGDRRRPYGEGDLPRPLSVYGASKLAGEHFVRALCPKHFVVRTCGLYGAAGSRQKRGNFVETMLRLAREGKPIRVVKDQVCTPTYTLDLARAIRGLLGTRAYGLYHITNRGRCSWYQFAREIFERAGLDPDLRPTTTAAFGSRARRPAYSVLGGAALRRAGLRPLRPWPRALEAYMVEKGHTRA